MWRIFLADTLTEKKNLHFLTKLKQSWNDGKSRMAILGLVLFVTDLNLISYAGGAYESGFEQLPSKPVMKCAIPIQVRPKDYS